MHATGGDGEIRTLAHLLGAYCISSADPSTTFHHRGVYGGLRRGPGKGRPARDGVFACDLGSPGRVHLHDIHFSVAMTSQRPPQTTLLIMDSACPGGPGPGLPGVLQRHPGGHGRQVPLHHRGVYGGLRRGPGKGLVLDQPPVLVLHQTIGGQLVQPQAGHPLVPAAPEHLLDQIAAHIVYLHRQISHRPRRPGWGGGGPGAAGAAAAGPGPAGCDDRLLQDQKLSAGGHPGVFRWGPGRRVS